jgi:hypothetical protein
MERESFHYQPDNTPYVFDIIRRAVKIPPGPKRDGYVYGYCDGNIELIKWVKQNLQMSDSSLVDNRIV